MQALWQWPSGAQEVKGDGGGKSAGGGVVGVVILDGLGGGVRGDGEVYGAFGAGVVSGAEEVGLRRVGVVGRSGRAGTAGGGYRAVDAAHPVDREVGEAYRLAGVGVGEGGEAND